MNDQTLDRMRKMKLYGMFRMFKASIDSVRRDNLTPEAKWRQSSLTPSGMTARTEA